MTLEWKEWLSNDLSDCKMIWMIWNDENDIWMRLVSWMTVKWDGWHSERLKQGACLGREPEGPDPPFVPTLCQEYPLTIGLGGSGPSIVAVSFCNYNYHDSYHFPVILCHPSHSQIILAPFPSFHFHLYHFPVIVWHPSQSSLIPIIPHSSISFSSHSHHSTLIHLSLAPFQSFQGHFT